MDNTAKSAAILNGRLAEETTRRFTERTFRIFNDADHLSHLASKWKNVAADKAQGHMFEQLETIKFNYDALRKDSELFAKTTASMGLGTDPVDIIISDGKKTLREVQAKSCNHAAASTFALSDKKYAEMMRLSPSDQHAEIEKLLKQRIAAGTLKAGDYEQTLRNLKKDLQYDNVSSGGTTYQQATEATNQSVADRVADEFRVKSALTDMHESGKRAGNMGAAVAGGISAISEGFALFKGEKELGEVTVNIVLASAKGYATGYAVTALSKGVTHTASYYLGTGIASTLVRSNAPVAIASGVVNASKSMIAFMQGEIDAEQLSDEISHTAITSTASFYYGAVGQAIIPIPVVGALVGAGVGYFIGNMIHQSGLLALGDSAVVKAAKAHRKQVEAMCLAAIPEIQRHRHEMEQMLSQHFAERKAHFTDAFSAMDAALYEWEPDNFMAGLTVINDQFGGVLPFKNFSEFDAFMKSDEALEF
ncbi:hypothetical protein [Enterobacter sp.]|uniref:hypothetical protein n=1 Tax=Enterobacter sp. TaxID=42895 RepID=UPI00296E3E6E|nr:hypothetical protein [Enterobacter sp.]